VSSKRLGRGINAIINSKKEFKNNYTGIDNIKISTIKPNPNQPRNYFDQDSLIELSDSISEKGVISPITVREISGGYEIIAGERRWRAAKKAKLKSIPAYIIGIENDSEMMEVALIENIQREDLNPIEEAEGYSVLSNKYDLSHAAIAKSIGKKRATISNALRLLRLPSEIRKSIRLGEISAGHGRAILQKKSIPSMKSLWKKIVNESLSVRQTEALAKKNFKNKNIKKNIISKGPIRAVENQLVEIFGTKVRLKPSQVGGSIEIIYFSDDDLARILDLLNSL